MRTYISSLLLIAILVFGNSPNAWSFSSLQNEIEDDVSLSATLQDGFWQSPQNANTDISFHFYGDGSVDRFIFLPSGELQFNTYEWVLLDENLYPSTLQLSTSEEFYEFEIDAYNQRIVLKETSNGMLLELEQQSAIPKNQYASKAKMLLGKWENTMYPVYINASSSRKVEQAYLKYQFSPDGRFERRLSNCRRSIKEAGNWMLAKDGKHLILRLDNGAVTVASLKYITLDELVLKHVLYGQYEQMTIDHKDFFFNRN
jgi:hypothetical protein